MHAAVRPLADQFYVTTNFLIKALGGLERDALLTRPGARSNPPIWIAGHLAQSRARLVNLLGGGRAIPWPGLFETGSRVVDLAIYPEAEAIVSIWRELASELDERLEMVDGAALEGNPPPRTASPDGTLRGAIALFAFHEGYHIGQLGFLRKWLGYGPLID
jgi:hypothetical protein